MEYNYSMKSSRFAVAAHILVSVEYATRGGEVYFPSTAIAASVNTNPVFVRELLRKLSKARLKHNTRSKDLCCPVSCGMDMVLEPVVSEVESALLDILRERKLCELVNKIADQTGKQAI